MGARRVLGCRGCLQHALTSSGNGPLTRVDAGSEGRTELAMNPEQCRAARALLGIGRPELARIAKVGRNTILFFEQGHKTPSQATIRKLRAAFTTLSIRFINDGDGVGVRRGCNLDEVVASPAYKDTYRRINPVEGPITPEQSRAARAFLNLSQQAAARDAGVGLSLLVSFENGDRVPRIRNLTKLRDLYEKRGIVFSEIDGTPAVQAAIPRNPELGESGSRDAPRPEPLGGRA